MGRRVSSREFKVGAVRLVVDRGVTFRQAAKDLRKWSKDLGSDPGQAFPGRGRSARRAAARWLSPRQENKQLKQLVADLPAWARTRRRRGEGDVFGEDGDDPPGGGLDPSG